VVTTTSCFTPATVSVTFRPTAVSASTMMPSRTNVWNPSSVTVSRYSPGGSGDTTYTPASVVWRVVATSVATFVAVTVAPGSAAFDESRTVP
jgi:hypothetical protein